MFTAQIHKSEMQSCTDTIQSCIIINQKTSNLKVFYAFQNNPKTYSQHLFFSSLLYFSASQNVCCHLYLTANAKYRQPYRSERLKFLLVLLFPSAHSSTSTPSLALVLLISMLFHLSFPLQYPQFPVVPLSPPPHLIPALVF